jgi:serine/threonine protein kinase
MAVVYYTTDVNLERPAAVKVIDARFRDNPVYTQRFLQEARSVATWRHEHILQVYYADEQDGIYFYAMEYIDGQNLAELLDEYTQQGKTLPHTEVLRYGRAIAWALDYAHEHGVIHRDVKPSNVLVTEDGRVVLGDFGLALDIQQGTLGEAFGTAHYTAPEQARRSSDAVPQSDLYSLGVMLYEMFTGVLPFDDPSPTSVALQHISLPPPPPRVVNPALSEELEAVLLKALAKNPEERYTSGAAFIAALEHALTGTETKDTAIQNTSQPVSFEKAPDQQAASISTKEKFQRSSPLVIFAGALGCGSVLIPLILIVGFILSKIISPVQPAMQAPDSATPTLVGTNTPAIVEVIVSATPLPTQTTPSQATATAQETTPAPINTPYPTDTPAITSPTDTPYVLPTPTWTPRYTDGRRMILFWNESSFYMLQVTGYGELIHPLAFELLDANDLPTNRFSARLWAEFQETSLRDWCMRLEISGAETAYLNPIQCQEKYLATRWLQPGDETIFWTQQEGTHQFRVLWGEEEVQRCEISAGTCEFYIP